MNEMTEKKLRIIIMWPLIVAGYVIGVYITFQQFWPFKTLVVQSPLPIVNQHVYKPGDTVQAKLSYCKYRSQSAIVTKQLVDGFSFTFSEPIVVNRPKGCATTIIDAVTLPQETPGGTYHVMFTATYKISAFRTTEITYKTAPFLVQDSQ